MTTESTNGPQPPQPRRKFSWAAAFTLMALFAVGLAAFVFLRLETWPARTGRQAASELERVGRELRDAFVDIAHLQPRITIANRVYVEQTTPTAELALISRQIEVEHEFSHTWAGSTKRVKLHGTFDVKAGFDLQKDVSVDLRENEITVQLPHATILSVAQQNIDVLSYENGFWNRISPADLENELAALPQLAREKALQSGVNGEAERSLQKQLTDRLHASRPIRLLFNDPMPKRP